MRVLYMPSSQRTLNERRKEKKTNEKAFSVLSLPFDIVFAWDVCDLRQAPAVPNAISLALVHRPAIVPATQFAVLILSRSVLLADRWCSILFIASEQTDAPRFKSSTNGMEKNKEKEEEEEAEERDECVSGAVSDDTIAAMHKYFEFGLPEKRRRPHCK